MSAGVGVSSNFDGRTVLLVGAGCAAGAILARAYARAGGRVILLDPEEGSILRIAQSDPARIDPLRLDMLDPKQFESFAEIWAEEPLHVLVHLQPLRVQMRPATAMASVVDVTERLEPALRAGAGQVLIIYEALPTEAPLGLRVFQTGVQGLAQMVQERMSGTSVKVNALELHAVRTPQAQRQFVELALWLTGRDALSVEGSVLRIGEDAALASD